MLAENKHELSPPHPHVKEEGTWTQKEGKLSTLALSAHLLTAAEQERKRITWDAGVGRYRVQWGLGVQGGLGAVA